MKFVMQRCAHCSRKPIPSYRRSPRSRTAGVVADIVDDYWPYQLCHGQSSLKTPSDVVLAHARVLEHGDPDEARHKGASANDQHDPLRITVRVDHGGALGGTPLQRQLRVNITEDLLGGSLGSFGQVLEDLVGKHLVPDSSANGLADGTTNCGDDAKEGKTDSDVFVRDSDHNGDLLDLQNCCACHGAHYLNHDEQCDATAWCTEVDEETSHGDLNRHGDNRTPFEGIRVLESKADDNRPGTGNNEEDVGDVACLGSGELVDDLEIRGIVHLV
jgi:hypothetical protein